MNITEIKLKNFRNYEYQELELNKGINIFYGNNAQGKTNILESIFLCSIGKSFRNTKEKDLIKLGEKFSELDIKYQKSDREGKIKYIISDKKEILVNGIKINKLSELIGKINIVMFSPDDIDILKGSPQKRRKFLNMMISQLRPSYIYNFNLYTKALEERNNYLRQIKDENKTEELLEIWDEKLADYAECIYNYRKEFIDKIKEKIEKIHKGITDQKEEIKIHYITDFIDKNNFLEKLKINRKKDIEKGYTTVGIHRDDFIIYINKKALNIYGSQGQFRTAILSLKLAELYIIYDEIGEYPILLLDDFMSELDENRRKKFIQSITEVQVLITGTHKIILENLKYNIYNVKEGKITKE